MTDTSPRSPLYLPYISYISPLYLNTSPLYPPYISPMYLCRFHMLGVVPFDRRRVKVEEEEKRRSRLLRGNTAPLKHRNTHELQGRSLSEMPLAELEARDIPTRFPSYHPGAC